MPDPDTASSGWTAPDSASTLINLAKWVPDDPLRRVPILGEEVPGSNLGTMDLWFQNGRVYTFFNVPEEIYKGLLSAQSPGSYYNSEIRGQYS